MNKIKSTLLAFALLAATLPALAQTNTLPINPLGTNGLSGITLDQLFRLYDASKTYYQTNGSEFEINIGAAYSQKDSEAANTLGFKYFKSTGADGTIQWGGGVQILNLANQSTAAIAPSFEVRKTFGNIAVGLGLGGGYDFENAALFGDLQLRAYYRTTKNFGFYVATDYVFEAKNGKIQNQKERGQIAGAGLTWSFW